MESRIASRSATSCADEPGDDGGVLAVEMNVMPRGGASERTWTLRTETDAIGGELAEVGGNRYAWLVSNDFDGLALDNITRVQN